MEINNNFMHYYINLLCQKNVNKTGVISVMTILIVLLPTERPKHKIICYYLLLC